MQINDLVWTEKYRPRTLDELIISPEDKSKLESYIKNPQSMPNLLFVGLAGIGKTSIARLIPSLIGCKKGDVMILNASDDRKIDTIRNRIVPFITAKRRNNKIPKIIHMDEFDGTNTIFQDALRPYMEGSYNDNTKFILTANRIGDISPAIQERCVIFDLANVDKALLYTRMREICDKENIKYVMEGIYKLIDINYPSRRKMISTLQKLRDIGITEQTVKTENEMNDSFYGILIDNNIPKRATRAREFIIQNGLDCRELLKFTLFKTLQDTTTTFDTSFKYKLSQYTIGIDHAMADGADNEIQMWGFISYFVTEMGI